MKIETDRAEVTSGVRHGKTLGSPVSLRIANRDYANWEERMNPWPVNGSVEEVHLPRPGHADLAGVQKFGFTDVRNVLERASARETTARVAAGGLAKALLREMGVEVFSHVTQIGSVRAPARESLSAEDFARSGRVAGALPGRGRPSAEMVEEINRARKANESLGGVYEVCAFGLVPGLGSYLSWEERLDGRLAQAIMSIQAMKGVGIGDGFDLAGRVGSQAHDEIFFSEEEGSAARYQPRRWRGGRHVQRRHAGRGGRDEAAAHADQAAAVGGPGHPRARAGAARAHRLLHRPGGRRGGRGDGGAGARVGVQGEVRRRPRGRRDRSAARLRGAHRMEALATSTAEAGALVFIGFMGAGKTSAARTVAAELGAEALDSDRELERELGEPLEQYFDREGESVFRLREEEVVLRLLGRDDARVIALGGGSLGSARVREALGRHTVIHLEVDPEDAWRRASGKGRPLARDRGRFDQLHGTARPSTRPPPR